MAKDLIFDFRATFVVVSALSDCKVCCKLSYQEPVFKSKTLNGVLPVQCKNLSDFYPLAVLYQQ